MSFLDSLVVRISACHVEGPGSIPGRGEFFVHYSQVVKQKCIGTSYSKGTIYIPKHTAGGAPTLAPDYPKTMWPNG